MNKSTKKKRCDNADVDTIAKRRKQGSLLDSVIPLPRLHVYTDFFFLQ